MVVFNPTEMNSLYTENVVYCLQGMAILIGLVTTALAIAVILVTGTLTKDEWEKEKLKTKSYIREFIGVVLMFSTFPIWLPIGAIYLMSLGIWRLVRLPFEKSKLKAS